MIFCGKKKKPEFTGIVVEVLNGSTVVVLDEKKKAHKLNLASIKVPRLGNAFAEEKEKKEAEKEKKEDKEEKSIEEIGIANKQKDEER